MKRSILSLAALSVVGSILSWSASVDAKQACVTRDDATERLENKFQEKAVGRGLATSGKQMLELFVSDKGSWTLLVSHPNGQSCIVASGKSWHDLPQLPGEAV